MGTRLLVVCATLLALVSSAFGTTAKDFRIPSATLANLMPGSKDSFSIDQDQDHFSITLIDGWIYSKDGAFKALISAKSKLAVSINGQVTYFDGAQSTFSRLLENTDVSKTTDRPWGTTLTIFQQQPADTNPLIDLRVSVYRDDRLSNILNGAKSAEPANIATSMVPWMAYGNLLSAVLTSAFGTTKTGYPFSFTGNIQVPDIVSNGKMQPHYIVLISPNKDGDQFVSQIDKTKLKYNASTSQLVYNGTQVTDHSYVVLQVSKDTSFKIEQLLAESQAPWAVLANSQFLFLSTEDVTDKSQVVVFAKNLLNQLNTELNLLKNEHRFSKYDRAVASVTFATESKAAVASVCSKNNIAAANCPTTDLDAFISKIRSAFGLTEDTPLPAPGKQVLDLSKVKAMLSQ